MKRYLEKEKENPEAIVKKSKWNGKGYLAIREEKLQEQAARPLPEKRAAHIFQNCALFFNGRTGEGTALHLAARIQQHGGKTVRSANKATHIIAENLSGSKTEKAVQSGGKTKVVRPDWITSSIDAGKRLPIHPFLVIHTQRRGLESFFGMAAVAATPPTTRNPRASTLGTRVSTAAATPTSGSDCSSRTRTGRGTGCRSPPAPALHGLATPSSSARPVGSRQVAMNGAAGCSMSSPSGCGHQRGGLPNAAAVGRAPGGEAEKTQGVL